MTSLTNSLVLTKHSPFHISPVMVESQVARAFLLVAFFWEEYLLARSVATLAGADKKDLMRKLPKFIYDEEKALEKTRKVLAEKIAQLNSAIDDVSAQLRPEDDTPNGVAVDTDEVEAAI
ncbi:hypothetical protein HYC85_020845 [Camellia sinensis]|uniref:Uncharacterized protein n=1 Tax=Camellia sinensis TaxID=4442 RepID=A0A7J7GR09_CAMSI|nr:hypothetical protein HYC85_020845 [Camellia sinensis]